MYLYLLLELWQILHLIANDAPVQSGSRHIQEFVSRSHTSSPNPTIPILRLTLREEPFPRGKSGAMAIIPTRKPPNMGILKLEELNSSIQRRKFSSKLSRMLDFYHSLGDIFEVCSVLGWLCETFGKVVQMLAIAPLLTHFITAAWLSSFRYDTYRL